MGNIVIVALTAVMWRCPKLARVITDKKIKRKSGAAPSFSPVRRKKVLEIKGKLNGYKFLTYDEKIVLIFEDIDTKEKGISKKEIALVLFPDDVKENGDPTPHAIDRTENALAAFRGRDKRYGITPCFVKIGPETPVIDGNNMLGAILYFAIQTKKQYEEMIRVKKQTIDGMNDHTQKDLENIGLSQSKKDELIETAKFLIVTKNRRKKVT